VQLRVAEQYIPEFGKLAKAGNTLVLPLAVSDVGSMVALMTNVVRKMAPDSSTGTHARAPAKDVSSTHGAGQ
jgi:hypothetical protein